MCLPYNTVVGGANLQKNEFKVKCIEQTKRLCTPTGESEGKSPMLHCTGTNMAAISRSFL